MTFTISILIKGTIILLLTMALVLALKKSSASLRHLIISLGLFGSLLLPVFQYFIPVIEVEMPIVEQLELEKLPLIWEEEITSNTSIESVEKESPESTKQDAYLSTTQIDMPVIKSQKEAAFFQFSLDWKATLYWIWIIGCFVFGIRMLVQMIRIWIIYRKSQPIPIPLENLNLKVKRKVRFSKSSMIKTPMTFGIFQPKILLPNTSEDWSKEQMKIVLLHELAHIKRQDYLLHLLGLISLSLYWFHPLVWFLQKWQQEEREKACDEYVLKQGISKTNYAESLVNIARHMLSKKAYRWHSELPMAASSETKKRVLAILKFDLQQWQFTRWMQWRWIGFFACVLPLLAAIHPATRELMEESIPKIEAVLEQPVFVPKEEFVENKGVAVNNVKNVRVTNNDRGLKVLDTLAQLPLNTIQQMSAKNHLPKKITDIKIQGEKSLKHYSKWGGYDDRSESQDSIIDTDKIKAFYGKWEEDNHIIEIWIRGQYELQNSLPFFTNLSPKSLILIQKREKGEGKKCCEKLIIQQLKHNGRLGKKGYRDGIPIRAGENIYTYEGDNAKKTRYTITASQYGGFKFSGKKKDYRAALQTWKEMDIVDLVKKMQADPDFLQPMQEDDSSWESMTNPDAGVPGLAHVFPASKKEWEKIIQAYEIEQTSGKEKKKEAANQVKVPKNYTYIPSGNLKPTAEGEEKAVSIQGFYMSETEITNQQYREFLRAMERRGKTELLKKARIYNENWVRNYHYGEPMYNEPLSNTYHLHPAYDKYPVVNISHEGAEAYCQWLTELYNEVNKMSAWRVEVRLPSKGEWMYAAQGGHQLAYYPWGSNHVRNAKGCYLGNFKQIDESKLIFDSKNNTFAMADSSVTMSGKSLNGKYKYIDGQGLAMASAYFPNNYGLYNMSGNAAEMLQEKGSTKGGSWSSTGYHVRIDAADEYAGWEESNPYIGFRPIIVVKKKK